MPDPKPIVKVVTFCEKVLIEKDGVLSAIRVFDRFLLPELQNVAPGAVPVFTGTILVCLRSGDFTGSLDLGLRLRSPSGEIRDVPQKFPSLFNGGDHGVNLIVETQISARDRGLHWIEVMAGEEILARSPFSVLDAPPPSGPTV